MTTLQPVEFGGKPYGRARRLPDAAPEPTEEAPPPQPDPNGYDPEWNIGQVLAWVDATDGPANEVPSDRAKAAMAAEYGRDTPRKTLLAELQERTG